MKRSFKRFRRTIAAGLGVLGFVAALGVARDAAGVVVVRTAVGYRPPPPHPVATTAAVAGTAIAVGTVVHSVPPSCTTTVVGNVAYKQCGGTWYQPRYAGSEVTYVVVAPPR
jgi:hypothetical protein